MSKIALPDLPFGYDALAPYISKETLEYHHDKHHKKYVENINKLIKDTQYESMSLEEIIKKADGPIFNNAAQVWNHTFYWNSLSPDGGKPSDEFAKLKDEFIEKASKHFGSGWCWIVKTDGGLKVVDTHDADTPVKKGDTPILVVDVWEHAYYIDYRNDRGKYLDAVWNNILNWKFAEENYG